MVSKQRTRLNRMDQEKLREKINASKLISMIECFITGEPYNFGGRRGEEKIEWSPSQYQAAKNLLDKSLPSLTNVALEDMPDVSHDVADKPVEKTKDWLEKHKPNVVPISGSDSN